MSCVSCDVCGAVELSPADAVPRVVGDFRQGRNTWDSGGDVTEIACEKWHPPRSNTPTHPALHASTLRPHRALIGGRSARQGQRRRACLARWDTDVTAE